VEQFLAGERLQFSFAFGMHGTPFQKQVWTELLLIPYGETVSYSEVASRIGRPSAARAVGMANGRNPLLLIIPCHRVIAASGELNGWSGGPQHKEALIQLEKQYRDGLLAKPAPSGPQTP
jgi:methylated-DNA-[protein]-cysteine S-methyltransferase